MAFIESPEERDKIDRAHNVQLFMPFLQFHHFFCTDIFNLSPILCHVGDGSTPPRLFAQRMRTYLVKAFLPKSVHSHKLCFLIFGVKMLPGRFRLITILNRRIIKALER